MPIRLFTYLSICLLAVCLQAPLHGQATFNDRLDALLRNAPEDTEPFYVEIANKGQVFYQFSSGNATANTRYRVASSSKWYVAAVLLKLEEDGRLDLDDKVAQYIPSFKNNKAFITVGQLLNHTSGLPTKSIYTKDQNLTLAQSVDSIAIKENLVSTPGAEFSYGSASFQIAARIAEIVTGKSWEQLFKDIIADPCGMTQTDYGQKLSKDIGDGAYSTAADFHKFLMMLLNNGSINGRQVLSESSIKKMKSNQIGDIPISFTPYKLRSSQHSRYYGLGIWLDRMLVNKNTATEFSSAGGRGFIPWINTCKNITGVFSTYSRLEKVQPLFDSIKLIIDHFYPDKCNDWMTEGTDAYPPAFTLDQNFPNPASMITNISFTLDKSSFVMLRLFDPLGNMLRELQSGTMSAGEHSIPISMDGLEPGVYFYRLQVNEHSETKKLTVKK